MPKLAEDVQYVRLPERLIAGNVTDVLGGSGWGISGLDVKEVPDRDDEPEAWQFVIDTLRAGHLEEAAPEEFEAVHETHKAVEKVAMLSLPTEFGGPAKPSPWNEAAIDNVAKRQRRRLIQARVTNDFSRTVHDLDEPDGPAGEDEEDEYLRQHKAELQNLARARGLDDSGNKKALAARLHSWDEEHPDGQ